MKLQDKANYLKTLYLYELSQVQVDNPSADLSEARQLAKDSLKTTLSKRVSIGDGFQKSKTDGGGSPTGEFEIKLTALVRGLKPFQIQGLSINGSSWSTIRSESGNPTEEIRTIIIESPDSFSAIRLYDSISGVYSNIFKLI
jgi:hypothetical protein